jgi:hypothetical protein
MSWWASQKWLARLRQDRRLRYRSNESRYVVRNEKHEEEAIQWTKRKNSEKKIRMLG